MTVVSVAVVSDAGGGVRRWRRAARVACARYSDDLCLRSRDVPVGSIGGGRSGPYGKRTVTRRRRNRRQQDDGEENEDRDDGDRTSRRKIKHCFFFFFLLLPQRSTANALITTTARPGPDTIVSD